MKKTSPIPLPAKTLGIIALSLAGLGSWPAHAAPQENAATERHRWHGETLGYPDYRFAEETFFEKNTNYIDNRLVLAWYMPTTSVFPSWDSATIEQREENFICEIQMAQSMGIDGFGLDIMRDNENYHRSIEAMFRAAERLGTGFKLFFEFDYGAPTLEARAADIQMLLKKYGQHEAYLQVEGKPLVGAYAPDGWVRKEDNKPDYEGSMNWWRDNVTVPLQEDGIEIYFAPTTFRQIWGEGGRVSSSQAEIAAWGDLIDGISLWQIQLSPIGGGLQKLENLGKAAHDGGKSWMTTVSMHYWVGAGRSVPGWYWTPGDPATANTINGRYYEHAGGKGLDMQWRSVINVQKPEWVMMLTWNDYNESYFMPVDDLRKYRNGTGQAPFGWYKSMAALGELNRYYIQWYKTGVQPTITDDTVFFSYRTSSHKLIAQKDPRPPVGIGNPPFGDDIYITSMLAEPAQLRVYSGETNTQYEVPAGIHHLVVPFHAGRQFFSLWRDGVQIAGGEGTPVNRTIDYYDYWPTTGLIQVPRCPTR